MTSESSGPPIRKAIPPTILVAGAGASTGDTLHNSAQDSVVAGPKPSAKVSPPVSLIKETGLSDPLQLFSVATRIAALLDPTAVASHHPDETRLDATVAQSLLTRTEQLLSDFRMHSQPNEWYCFRMLYLRRQALQQLSAEMAISEQDISTLISRSLEGFHQQAAQALQKTLVCWGLSADELQLLAQDLPDLRFQPEISAPTTITSMPLIISPAVEPEFLDWCNHQEQQGHPLPPVILLHSLTETVSTSLRLKLRGMIAPGHWARLRQLLACPKLQASEGTAAEACLFLLYSETLELQCAGRTWLPAAFWRVCPPELADHIRGCQTCRTGALEILQTHAGVTGRTIKKAFHEARSLDQLWDDITDPDSDSSG